MPIIERVVDKFILELDAQLNEKKVFLQLTPAARRYLAEKGYDPTFGARPMARLIQTEIKRVLADEILFGRLREGGKVEIDVRDGALVFDYAPVDRTAAVTGGVPGSPGSGGTLETPASSSEDTEPETSE